MKEIKIYNTLECTIVNETRDFKEEPEFYAGALAEALEKEETDLAPYGENKKLRGTKIETEWVGKRLYGLCICKVENDWTDKDTEWLKDYLAGQYADGWGEGFEQREIYSFEETETYEEYDEENDETYESEEEVRYDVYISFWQSKNFKIMTEEEINK